MQLRRIGEREKVPTGAGDLQDCQVGFLIDADDLSLYRGAPDGIALRACRAIAETNLNPLRSKHDMRVRNQIAVRGNQHAGSLTRLVAYSVRSAVRFILKPAETLDDDIDDSRAHVADQTLDGLAEIIERIARDCRPCRVLGWRWNGLCCQRIAPQT